MIITWLQYHLALCLRSASDTLFDDTLLFNFCMVKNPSEDIARQYLQ